MEIIGIRAPEQSMTVLAAPLGVIFKTFIRDLIGMAHQDQRRKLNGPISSSRPAALPGAARQIHYAAALRLGKPVVHCATLGVGLRNGDFNHTFRLVIWKIIDLTHRQ